MKRISLIRTSVYIGMFVTFCMIYSCATTDKSLPTSYSVSLQKLDEKEIVSIKTNKSINPYLEPGSIIRGKVNEFVIFKIDLSIENRKTVYIDNAMKDNEGNNVTSYYSESFLAYWDQYSDRTGNFANPDMAKKRNLIEQTCLPGSQMDLKPGLYSFYLVFIGPYPLSKPAHAQINISTSIGEYNPFQFTIE